MGLGVCHARAITVAKVLWFWHVILGCRASNCVNCVERCATTGLGCDAAMLVERIEDDRGSFAQGRGRGRRYDTVHWVRACTPGRVDENGMLWEGEKKGKKWEFCGKERN